MAEIITKIADFLSNHLGALPISILIIALGTVYIWYQHHRNKLLDERLQLEKERTEKNKSKETEKYREGSADRLRLLWIDDEPELTQIWSLLIEQLSPKTRVIAAYNGAEGLAKVLAEQPQLILLDINMPDMTGFDVLKVLVEKEYPGTVIICSGYVRDKSDVERAAKKLPKSWGILPKPFSSEDLMAIIEKQNHERKKSKQSQAKNQA